MVPGYQGPLSDACVTLTPSSSSCPAVCVVDPPGAYANCPKCETVSGSLVLPTAERSVGGAADGKKVGGAEGMMMGAAVGFGMLAAW